MNKKNKIELVENLAKELFEKLDQKVKIKSGEEDEGIKINISSEDPGPLIGFHGKTLSSIQLILGLMVFQKLGKWQQIVVDVDGYRKEQAERLQGIALNSAKRAKFSGRPVALSPMTPFERRVIHMTLNDDPDVSTESEGRPPQRYVVITPKPSS
jgi:spoIIIJ-associated protein